MCKINGKKLKEIREREGLTLQDVAKGCGVSYSTISKYENEINNPSDAVHIAPIEYDENGKAINL